MRAILLALLLVACDSCTPLPRPTPQPEPAPTNEPDPQPLPPMPDDCSAFCEAIERLACASAWGIDANDGSCSEFCADAVRRGDFCPGQARGASSCAQVESAVECQL